MYCMERLIVSVHIAKTGGCSFGSYLKSQFGDEMYFIYHCLRCESFLYATTRDRVHEMQQSDCAGHGTTVEKIAQAIKDNHIRCIHGHFAPKLFSPYFNNPAFVVWFRNPADRAVSEYEFLRRCPDAARKKLKPLLEEGRQVEFYEHIANVQSRFIGGMPLEKFDFIGITEHFERDIRLFARQFGLPDKEIPQENVNPQKGVGHYALDPETRAMLERINSVGMHLYRAACEIARQRIH